MVIGPGAIGCDLIDRDPAAEAVEVGKNNIVDLLEVAHQLASCDLLAIVKLSHSLNHIAHHVVGYQGVMRVRVNLRPKQELYEGVSIAHTHSINKDVTWTEFQCLNTDPD